jgi:hypothetical protein
MNPAVAHTECRKIQVWLEVKLSARDPFDNQHGTGAGGTTQQVRCCGAICAFHCAEQLAATCEGGLPSSVGEETKVTDSDGCGPALWAEREEEIGAGTHLLKLA